MFKKISLILLVVLIASVYLYTAHSRAILDDGDALYAHIAKNMATGGNWVTPYADGVRFLDKPPMMFWLMAISFKLFGFNEFAARLPSMLAVLGTSLLLYFMGKQSGGRLSGFIAGVSSAFCVGVFLFTLMAFPDIIFVFFLTLSQYAFLDWYSNRSNPLVPALVFYASLAGAVLTKGLIGLFFPIASVALFLTWTHGWSRLRYFHIWKGALLFLILALPWHILAALRNTGFLWYFFVNEQFLRFLGRRLPMDYESISLPIFWALILAWAFPWSTFFPSIGYVLRIMDLNRPRLRAAILLCTCWAVVVLVFFSFSSRIEHYSLPILPPLALLMGVALTPDRLDATVDSERQRSINRSFGFLGILGGIIAIGLLGLLSAGGLSGFLSAQRISAGHQHAYNYYFAPLFDFPPRIINRLMTPFWVTGAAFAAGLISSWWLNLKGLRTAAVTVLSLMMVVFCISTYKSLYICEEILSSKQFGLKLNQLYAPGDRLVVVGDYETANSIHFYAPVNLEVYGGTAAVLQWGLHYPDAPRRILSYAELKALWDSPQRAFLLVSDSRRNALGLGHSTVVMQSGGRILLRNSTN